MAKSNTSWVQGQSGNPAGRPKGSKDAITKAFLEDVTEDWESNGPATLGAAREKNPGEYCRMVASLLPKDLNVKNDNPVSDAFLAAMKSPIGLEDENARLKAEIAALKGEAPRVIDREARELSAVPIRLKPIYSDTAPKTYVRWNHTVGTSLIWFARSAANRI